MELATGTLLHGGTYRILNASEIIPKHKYTYLGQGSFGITYLAEHTSLGRKVAIKEFFMKELNTRSEDGSISGMTDGSLSYNYGQKFKKEAMNLSQLDHPNIVHVTDSFEENGTYYYVMDYIEGENLNDYLKHNAISQQEALSIITYVAKALQYMHDTKHMLHLDLKPGNIMRRATDGHIFLIDFGLSKHYSNSGQPETSTTIGLGTPGYAPIEQSNQAKNGEFRPTIDVYALGATLYKLLTRETPPAASDIVSDDELLEDKLRAYGISGNIIDVVVKAMLPNVNKRIQSVNEFAKLISVNENYSRINALADIDESTSFISEPVKPASKKEKKSKSRTDKKSNIHTQKKWVILLLFAVIGFGSFIFYDYYVNHEYVTARVYKDANGQNYTFTGYVSDNGPDGKGTGVYSYGTYTGEYKSGLRHGNGEFKSTDGSNKYKGTFSNDKYETGILTVSSGYYFNGDFKDGQPYNGSWYDKSGRFDSKVVNGK